MITVVLLLRRCSSFENMVKGLGCRVRGLGVRGLGFQVSGFGFRV